MWMGRIEKLKEVNKVDSIYETNRRKHRGKEQRSGRVVYKKEPSHSFNQLEDCKTQKITIFRDASNKDVYLGAQEQVSSAGAGYNKKNRFRLYAFHGLPIFLSPFGRYKDLSTLLYRPIIFVSKIVSRRSEIFRVCDR